MNNWIETTFNVSGGITQAIAVILALAVVLLLFGLFIFILKRLMGANAPQSRNRQPRIAIMDSATVDARRRLLLVRRDNIEHLILVGGPSDVVVEQNIVRNTPLPQARTGHHAPAPSGMAMPVKAPLAPGPEIPARPDELLPDEEAAAPAVQARTPVQASEPVPQHASPAPQLAAALAASPAPAPQPSTPVAPTYKAPVAAAPAPSAASAPSATSPTPPPATTPTAPSRNYSEPTVSRPLAARAAQTAPAPAAPSAQPATAQTTTPEEGGGFNRASDLLRAATQNGFNKAMPKPAAPVPPVQEVQVPQDAGEAKVEITASLQPEIQPDEPAMAAKAPEVRPDVSAASAPQESKATSTLKSLARPFTARDRPSYGGTISPPASGPAARAKTALLKPVEQVPQGQKVEPVLAAATVTAASIQPAEEDPPLPEEIATAPDQTAFAAQLPDDTSDATDLTLSAQLTADDTAGTDEAASAEVSADATEETVQAAGTTIEETAATEAQTAEKESPSPELTLDIGDLLEDVPEPSAPTLAMAPETAPVVQAQEQAQAETFSTPEQHAEDPEEDNSSVATITPVPSATVTPPAPAAGNPVTTSAPPVKAPVRPSAGLGDRNPIEEEMAKILDELGGQSNG
ncbi:hypothetical protein FMN63_21690 [Stappia sp. BW2]|uniref:flagellar biosynthetic protein FliO n=1 Tax=Stappia sp. BW2 TaxID=2592622 RepID=UPI0011DEFC2A|nr:flagellar biosynthetic protein FliO [Stappia sp. BW2]TYC65050.1 hypothetical protein FMN63_21690 [Stappia sp. BW2]